MAELLNSETLAKRLEEHGLGQYIPNLVPLLKSGIGIITHPADEKTIPVGASKFGGSPDLPRSEKWPELYGYSLDFIAQINLTDVMAYDVNHQLPSSGILFFFHNESRLGALEKSWTKSKGIVLYYDGENSGLERRQAPEQQYYTSCTLSFAQDANLPVYGDLVGEGIIEEMSDPHRAAFFALSKNISVVSYKESKANRILGYPEHVQVSPYADAETVMENVPDFKTSSQVNRDWILLLQVDSDSNANMFFGDYGALYFCILKEDLEQRQFDRTIVVSQSS